MESIKSDLSPPVFDLNELPEDCESAVAEGSMSSPHSLTKMFQGAQDKGEPTDREAVQGLMGSQPTPRGADDIRESSFGTSRSTSHDLNRTPTEMKDGSEWQAGQVPTPKQNLLKMKDGDIQHGEKSNMDKASDNKRNRDSMERSSQVSSENQITTKKSCPTTDSSFKNAPDVSISTSHEKFNSPQDQVKLTEPSLRSTGKAVERDTIQSSMAFHYDIFSFDGTPEPYGQDFLTALRAISSDTDVLLIPEKYLLQKADLLRKIMKKNMITGKTSYQLFEELLEFYALHQENWLKYFDARIRLETQSEGQSLSGGQLKETEEGHLTILQKVQDSIEPIAGNLLAMYLFFVEMVNIVVPRPKSKGGGIESACSSFLKFLESYHPYLLAKNDVHHSTMIEKTKEIQISDFVWASLLYWVSIHRQSLAQAIGLTPENQNFRPNSSMIILFHSIYLRSFKNLTKSIEKTLQMHQIT